MAFSVSETRTVLWDQFEYTGEPEDFSWVLPVARGAYLEEARQAFFDALEASTQAVVTAPPLVCATPARSGCAGTLQPQAASADNGRGLSDGPSVVVVDRRTVGPYETVTLRSTEGGELVTWLETNGYVVPAPIQPIIDAYVEEGYDFIALKLRPGQGVQQMTPVRVVTPGGNGVLPLRMVAAGVADQVDIVLFVIGEGRYSLPDLADVAVDTSELSYDFKRNTSNYARLRDSALSENGGFSVLTSYAKKPFFSAAFQQSVVTSGGAFVSNFPELYFLEAAERDERTIDCGEPLARFPGDQVVVDDFENTDAPNAGALLCEDYSDLAAALVGLRPDRTWLTRLEMYLPRTALTIDCVVEKSEHQKDVDNRLVATHITERPDGCEPLLFESQLSSSRLPPGPTAVWALAVGVFVAAGRRRQGRRARAT